jgi:hypothetical protein
MQQVEADLNESKRSNIRSSMKSAPLAAHIAQQYDPVTLPAPSAPQQSVLQQAQLQLEQRGLFTACAEMRG